MVFKNKSIEKNTVDKLILLIWNNRRTEYIWESWSVKLYKPNIANNWIGDEIEVPLVLEGKRGVEAIAIIPLPDDVFFNYLADRMPSMLQKVASEKPFHVQLVACDSNNNYFTGDLTKEGVQLLDYRSLRHMHMKSTDITNACTYGRPRVKHLLEFYLGRARRWVRFKIRKAGYMLGVVSSV